MTQSRAKGRRAEREVAALLAKWWGGREPKCEFKPTPLSGGWGGRDGGSHIRAHFKASGDLMTTAEEFPFTVEVKHREQWSMKTLVAGKRTPPWEWWRQAQHQATEESGVPMLWFKKNRHAWLIGLPRRYFEPGAALEAFVVDLHVPETLLRANGVDFGEGLPSFVFADRIMELPPEEFLRETSNG